MAQGRVKWFNDTKGFGIIEIKESGEEIFVHYSAISSDGHKTLREGQNVEFDLYDGNKGYQAKNVVTVN